MAALAKFTIFFSMESNSMAKDRIGMDFNFQYCGWNLELLLQQAFNKRGNVHFP